MPLPQQRLLMRVMVQSITVMTWVLLNNEMDDFSAKAGVPICLDLLEMKRTVLPHKRMLSSMTPTIVEKNGKLL
jgi:gamma-glutamyltranspeptidase